MFWTIYVQSNHNNPLRNSRLKEFNVLGYSLKPFPTFKNLFYSPNQIYSKVPTVEEYV